MSGTLNRATILGHLGRDPEIRSTQSGAKIASMSVATSESWKDKATGERRERTEWHRVVIFGEGLAGVAERYLRKGGKVYVEGQIQTRKWQDQAGVDRYSTEIVLQGFDSKLVLLDRQEAGRSDYSSHERNSSGSGGAWTSDAGQRAADSDLDDDVPF